MTWSHEESLSLHHLQEGLIGEAAMGPEEECWLSIALGFWLQNLVELQQ